MNTKKIMTVLLCGVAIASCAPRNADVGSTTPPQVTSNNSNALLIRRARPNIVPVGGAYSSFSEWKTLLVKRALASGIQQSTIDRALPYMTFHQRIVNNDRNQAEFKQTMMQYVDGRVSSARIGLGKKAMANYGSTIRQIANAYEVDESVIVGIWGLETNFGSFMGGINVFEAMSTLSYEGRRRDWAEKQLINALYIVQSGDRSPSQMEGSWAGGLGHTQFIPEMYNIYAIDFSRDGQRDVWNPVDALASTANFLRNESFQPGLRWGTEVRLPSGFDYSQASKENFKDASYWKSIGVTATSSRGLPNAPLAIFIPEGANGRAFAVTSNFKAIKRYNNSDSYALAVALLGDAVLGY